ncbi:MAG: DivIVA domain-containing protein [Clostridia bacterium]|nr:DivIVA domain-containing protein [Clostridia bacterium]
MSTKNRKFISVPFGYSKIQVNSEVKKLEEKIEAIKAEKDDVERKLADTEETLTELLKMNLNIEDTKKQANEIIQTAYENADKILFTTKSNCDAILKNFKQKVNEQKALLEEMKKQVVLFKSELFEKYRVHIEMIEKLQVDNPDDTMTADAYVDEVVSSLKKTIVVEYGINVSEVEPTTAPKAEVKVEPSVDTQKEAELVVEDGNEKFVQLDEKISSTQENKAISVIEMLQEYEKKDAKEFAAEDGIQLVLDIDAGIPTEKPVK